MLIWTIIGMMGLAYTVAILAAIYIGFIRRDPLMNPSSEINQEEMEPEKEGLLK